MLKGVNNLWALNPRMKDCEPVHEPPLSEYTWVIRDGKEL